jgi:hypothetical protein
MGLDVSHDAWHGAYSAFSRWRHLLAEAAGYEVAEIVEETISVPGRPDYKSTRPLVLIDWGHVKPENFQGEWAEADEPSDALLYLIVHSDCDGYLTPRHAGLVADRLQELLPSLPDEVVPGHIGDLRAKTAAFIKGCREAAATGARLEFG